MPLVIVVDASLVSLLAEVDDEAGLFPEGDMGVCMLVLVLALVVALAIAVILAVPLVLVVVLGV